RVLDRAVCAVDEPLRVFAYVGVVRRRLKRDVERDLQALSPCLFYESSKVRLGAELGMDGLVAPICGADRPRASRVVGARFEGVVGSLAEGLPDRMNRRKVENIEAHRGDVGQHGLHIAKGAVLAFFAK